VTLDRKALDPAASETLIRFSDVLGARLSARTSGTTFGPRS